MSRATGTDVWSSQPLDDEEKEAGDASSDTGPASGAWLGVDLGTSNTCVALWHPEKQRAKIIKSAQGERTTPSVAFLRSTDDVLVGRPALDEWARKPETGALVPSIKRVIGRRGADPELLALAPSLPFKVVEAPPGQLRIQAPTPSGAVISKRPEEVSGLLLRSLREAVEAYLRRKPMAGVPPHVDRAVITVPAHFNEAQKAATRQAGKLAGFKQVTLLSEPFAAAIAYGLFIAGKKTIVTFDMGGGTTDICLLQLEEGRFEVLALEGDTHLGGEDMDWLLLKHVLGKQGVAVASVPPAARTQLLLACAAAKVALSTAESAKVDVSAAVRGGKAVVQEVSRAEFEGLIQGLLERAKTKVEDAVLAGGLSASEVDEVILVGGCSRIPSVRRMLHSVFGEDKELCTAVDPDEAVAQGAAIRAAILSGVDASILRDVLMLDVIPLSIGVETADGGFEVLLPKNERLPCRATKYFEVLATQKVVQLHLREGESAAAEDNALIATVDLPVWHHMVRDQGGSPLHAQEPDGAPQQDDGEEEEEVGLVPVTVEMDESGRLKVSLGDPSHAEGDGEALLGPSTLPLLFYCVLLFALYIAAKLYFADHHLLSDDALGADGAQPPPATHGEL